MTNGQARHGLLGLRHDKLKVKVSNAYVILFVKSCEFVSVMVTVTSNPDPYANANRGTWTR